MRAVRHTVGGIEVLDVAPPSSGVIVRVTSAGICGSDLHLIAAGPLPQTLGHEFGGVLEDGTVVSVRPNAGCGACPACESDRVELCPVALTRILGVSADGGLAEYVGVDESCIVPLPSSVDPADAALAEPLAVAVHGLRDLRRHAHVLVVGAGPIGLCAIAVALDAGHAVSFVAHRAARGDAARRLGAAPAREGSTFEVVVDAAGTATSAATAAEYAAPGGTVVMLGTWWDPTPLDGRWQLKELTLLPRFMYGHADFQAAAAVLASVPSLREAMVTHRFALDDAAAA
ncbi:MAG TPA: alcohol dehydrogenase catalytic domain-containing protein, partial [Acidimicrobiales bacterium]|nr:alcohol dehydrogenase catalytic domain-containing protein [Acidimicrobiales bacterium]